MSPTIQAQSKEGPPLHLQTGMSLHVQVGCRIDAVDGGEDKLFFEHQCRRFKAINASYVLSA